MLAVAACDLRNPAGSLPVPVPAPSEPESRAEAVLVGTFSFPAAAMPNPGEVTSYAPHARTGITLEPNSYVLLRVGGTLQAEQNPHIIGTKPGEGRISYTAFESSQSTARGQTYLWLHPGGDSWLPPAGGENLTGYFLPDPADGRDLVLLVRVGAASADLWAQRAMLTGKRLSGWFCGWGYPYCAAGETEKIAEPNGVYTWIEDYWLKQSHTITATRIAEPLSVDGPAVVAPGKSATFTGKPWGDLRLRNKAGIFPRVWWVWWPGDTTAVPNPYVRPEVLPCEEQSCTYVPARSGRLRVQTYVEGAPVEVDRLVRVQKEQLELKCNGAQDSVRITRADELICQVSGATDIAGWEFRADSSGYRNPAEGGTPFRGIGWKGRVVLSGTVTVNARVAGAEESKSVRVRVEAREWGGMMMPRSISEEPNTHLPPRPDSLHDLGDIHQGMELEFKGMEKWAGIFTGPNANLAYLVKPPAEYTALVHVNRVALSRDSEFWKAQNTRQRSSGVVDCLQREADITDFIPVILRHEGIGFDPKSHAYLYVTTADRVGNPRYERVVGSTLQELADQSAAVREMAHDSAVAATALADSPGYRPTWCRFHFNYRSR